MPHGTRSTKIDDSQIIADYPRSQALSPIDLERKHGPAVVIWRRETFADYQANETDKNRKLAETFSQPATEDCILAHLIRLSTFLALKGTSSKTSEDDPQSMFLLADYTSRLFEAKTREVDLFLACEFFIETEEGGFFPTFARLAKRCQVEAK